MKQKMGWFFLGMLLLSIAVHAQDRAPIRITVDLGSEEAAVSSSQPSASQPSVSFAPDVVSTWLKGAQDWFSKTFPSPAESKPQTLQDAPPSAQLTAANGIDEKNNSVELCARFSGWKPGQTAEIVSVNEKGETVSLAPVSALDAGNAPVCQTVSLPQSLEKKSVPVLLAVTDESGSVVAKSPLLVLGTSKSAFEYSFLQLPDLDRLPAQERITVFQEASHPISKLPADEKFFKLTLHAPVRSPTGDFGAKGMLSFNNGLLQFENPKIVGGFGTGSIFGSPESFGNLGLFPTSEPSQSALNATVLVRVIDPNNSADAGFNAADYPNAVIITEPSSSAPLDFFFDFFVYPVSGESREPSDHIQNAFSLERETVSLQNTATMQNAFVELKKGDQPVLEFVGPPAPETSQADSVCLHLAEETKKTLPADAELELRMENQPVSKIFLPQLAGECIQLAWEKIQPVLWSFWQEKKKTVDVLVVAIDKSKKTERVVADQTILVRATIEPVPLKFVGLLESAGQPISQSRIDPVRPVQLQLEGVQTQKRLFVVASLEKDPASCGQLAAALSSRFSDSTSLENADELVGASNATAPSNAALSSALALFVKPGALPHASLPALDFVASDNKPVQNWSSFAGRFAVATVSGEELNAHSGSWKIGFLKGASPADRQALDANTVVFSACQFVAVKIPSVGMVPLPAQWWVVPVAQATQPVFFGKSPADRLLSALLAVDSKFVNQLFSKSVQVPVSKSPIKMTVTKNSVCLEGAKKYPALEQFDDNFLLTAESSQKSELVAIVSKAFLLAQTCANSPAVIALSIAAGATVFSLTGYWHGTPVTVAQTIVQPTTGPALSETVLSTQPAGSAPPQLTEEQIFSQTVSATYDELKTSSDAFAGKIVHFDGAIDFAMTNPPKFFLYTKQDAKGKWAEDPVSGAFPQGESFEEGAVVGVWGTVKGLDGFGNPELEILKIKAIAK